MTSRDHQALSPVLVARWLQSRLGWRGGTYTQRAIPGSEPSQDACTFRPDTDLMPKATS